MIPLPTVGEMTGNFAGAMASSISRETVFGMQWRTPDERPRILHVDTEQGKRSHYNMLALVKKLVGMQPAEKLPFHSLHCRQDSGTRIMQLIELYIKLYPDTSIIFADGLIDFIDSVNDERASKHLVNWLKRITEEHNLFLFAALHRSISVNKSIGHIGSTADRAAQSVLVVEKNKDTRQYILRAEYLREGDAFDPIAIHYNKELQTWEQTEYIDTANEGQRPAKVSNLLKRRPADYDIMQHAAYVSQIFNSWEFRSYDDLRQDIREVYGVGRDWATDCIKHLVSINQIWRTDNGYTNRSQVKMFVTTKK